MNLLKRTQKAIITFKKWGRKNFSLFSILKKEIRISVLSVAYFLAVPIQSVAMEPDTLKQVKMEFDLDEIEVSASSVPAVFSEIARVLTVINSKEIEQSSASSVQELLEQIASLDVRQRGAGGVQADISIRGGTFDQTLILLNGINITDPQTGHHNLNIPVGFSQIDRIEILNGPAARIYGPNAFSGAINIVTKQNTGNELSASIGTGSFGYFDSKLSVGFKTGAMNHMVAGNYTTSNGYIENTDYDISNVFYTGRLDSKAGKLALQAGMTGKGFGANSFYTPVYPNQYENIQTWFSSARIESFTKFNLTPAVYYRRHSDKFMLFRENPPEWYKNHNFHQTNVWGVNLNSWYLWDAGKTSLGAEFRSENILSNVLGEETEKVVQVKGENAFYTNSANRQSVSVFAEHIFYLNKWTFSGGILGHYISDNAQVWSFFPGVEGSYQLNPSLKFVASLNTSLRMPTFTDLFYSGPTNLGNPELKPEKSDLLEMGVKLNSVRVKGHVALFHSKGKDIIDWVKSENDELWHSMNHTSIKSNGLDVNVSFYPQKIATKQWTGSFKLGYLYNNQKKLESDLISYYVLDNLKHKLVIAVNQPFFTNVSADLKFIFQDREGAYTAYTNGNFETETAYKPFWLVDAKLMYRKKNFSLYVSSGNLLNKSYFDLGNVMQPGRWVKTGITYNFNFDE